MLGGKFNPPSMKSQSDLIYLPEAKLDLFLICASV